MERRRPAILPGVQDGYAWNSGITSESTSVRCRFLLPRDATTARHVDASDTMSLKAGPPPSSLLPRGPTPAGPNFMGLLLLLNMLLLLLLLLLLLSHRTSFHVFFHTFLRLLYAVHDLAGQLHPKRWRLLTVLQVFGQDRKLGKCRHAWNADAHRETDEYVRKKEKGSCFHLFSIEDVYRCRPYTRLFYLASLGLNFTPLIVSRLSVF